MNENRFKVLIDSYGADTSRWPADEVEAALAFLASSTDAKQWLDDALVLDKLLGQIDTGVDAGMLANIQSGIEARFEKTHPSAIDRLIKWLLPDVTVWTTTIWRPAMAACLPLVIGISIGLATATEDATLSSSEEMALLAISPTSAEVWLYE